MKIHSMGLLVVAGLAFAIPAIGASQQHDLTPPQELQQLAFLAGDWSGKQNFNTQGGPAIVGKAADHIEMIVGGRIVMETLSTELPGGRKSDTRHLMTYDAKAGKYRAWWFNDTSVNPTVLEGALNGNTLVLQSLPTGGPAPVLRATYERASDSEFTWTLEAQMKPNAAWTELFHTTYTKS